MTIKVCNFYAPPSSGKSTLAAACYVSMGYDGQVVQIVDEFIKTHADRKEYLPTPLDQPWILGCQSQLILNAAKAGYSHVFCQSDPLLCAWYAEWYNPSRLSTALTNLALAWEEGVMAQYGVEFHRFFIELPEVVYRERFTEAGRWQDFETVMKMQSHMREWVIKHCPERLHIIHETNPSVVLKEVQ